MIRFLKAISFLVFVPAITGCDLDIDNFTEKATNLAPKQMPRLKKMSYLEEEKIEASSMNSLLDNTLSPINFDKGFEAAIAAAVMADPAIIALEETIVAKSSSVRVLTSQKRLQGSGSIYSGFEDITDEVAGVALILNANRMLFDGGKLDSRIATSQFNVESEKYNLILQKNQRSAQFVSLWIDLERYEELNSLLIDRLDVLDPLIKQLEKIAKSGLGDVTMVSAANRTVDAIKVKKAQVADKLEQARLNFKNSFGALPMTSSLDLSGLTSLVPEFINSEMIQAAPAMLAEYAAYQAAEATLASVKAQDKINIGLEMRASRPFGNSGYDSDESVGFVFNKTLFNGNMLESEVDQAQAQVKTQISRLRATFREGRRIAQSSKQTVSTMQAAILLAESNAQTANEEITYLKQQLTIGGSTLGTVLKAEAGLYDAQARVINFTADKKRAEFQILAGLGILAESLGL